MNSVWRFDVFGDRAYLKWEKDAQEFLRKLIEDNAGYSVAKYASVTDAIKDSAEWRLGEYDDGQVLDCVMEWLTDLGLGE